MYETNINKVFIKCRTQSIDGNVQNNLGIFLNVINVGRLETCFLIRKYVFL